MKMIEDYVAQKQNRNLDKDVPRELPPPEIPPKEITHKLLNVAGLTYNDSYWTFNTSESFSMALWMQSKIKLMKESPVTEDSPAKMAVNLQFVQEQIQFLDYVEKSILDAYNMWNTSSSATMRNIASSVENIFYVTIFVEWLDGREWKSMQPLYAFFQVSKYFKSINEYQGDLLRVKPGTVVRLVLKTKTVEGNEVMADILHFPPGFNGEDADANFLDFAEYGDSLSLSCGTADKQFVITPKDEKNRWGLFLVKIYNPQIDEPLACASMPLFCTVNEM